ncbi:MAG: S8 family peptidase, partial [Coprococcus sp.]
MLECGHAVLHIYYGCLTECEAYMDCSEAITSEEYVDFIVEYNGDREALMNFYKGVCLTIIDDRYAVAYRSKPDDYMESFSRLAYNLFPKVYGLMDTSSMEATGVINVQRENVLGLTGKNAIIGIIDTGIDINNSLFRTFAGETRILAAWDQSAEYTGTARYNYGREYSKEEIQAAIESGEQILKDNTGHGTFLAGIAAGGRTDEYTGVAPEAGIVVVKLKEAKQNIRKLYGIPAEADAYAENDIMLGIAYILQIVYQYKTQVSLLIGLGTNSGSHTGSSALETYINNMGMKPGIAVSVAAGNEGVAGHHFAGIVAENESYDIVEINVTNNDSFTLEIWGQVPNIYSVALEIPGGEYIERIPPRFDRSERIKPIFGGGEIFVDYFLVEDSSGQELIMMRFFEPPNGLWRVRVYAVGDTEKRYDAWLPVTGFISHETRFIRPS